MNPATRKAHLLIFDGDCSFCRLWIERWKQITGDKVAYEPYQEASSQFPDIPIEEFKRSVQLITPEGERFSGADAVFRTLALVPGKRWMYWMYNHIPGAAFIAESFYHFVAKHRSGLYKLTRFLWGKHFEQPSYVLTRWVFIRFIGCIYLIAFTSYASQVLGLIGTEGILPAQHYLQLIRDNVGTERYWQFPTLAWLNSSDSFLQFFCWAGVGFSLLLISGIWARGVATLLWVLYLSLYVVGQTFLSFQWDILLLETGFLTIFFAPSHFLPRISREQPPSKTLLWLFRLLLFRLMFFSGYVKLATNDAFWLDLTALTVHYETQCIPTPIGWYAHQLPLWFHKFSCGAMFVIELAIPFLIFAPRRLRIFAAVAFIFFMILIILTGNYNFFNLLAIALCVLLLDDAVLKRLLPRKLTERITSLNPAIKTKSIRKIAVTTFVTVIVYLNIMQWTTLFVEWKDLPKPILAIERRLAPFNIVNSYGLFRVMTNPRYEIIVEGSNDGTTWLAYEFKYKPGDVKRAPPWVEPHQPRLDWQMWFAALGSYEQNQWFVNFCVRLLQGSKGVLALIEKNPFPNNPPRSIRALLYEYHFTDSKTKQASGDWWKRELKGLYLPAISLRTN